MSDERQHKHHRHPSGHRREMRFFTILIVVLAAVLFAVAFYCVNRWLVRRTSVVSHWDAFCPVKLSPSPNRPALTGPATATLYRV